MRLQHDARAPGGGGFGLQVRIAGALRADRERLGAIGEGADRPGAQLRLAADIVDAGVRAGDDARVDLFEVGRLEPLRIAAAQADAADHVPGARDLRLRDRADVAVMFEPSRQLEFEIAHQRHVHRRADDRDGQFGVGGEDGAAAAGVGRRAGADEVRAIGDAADAVGEGRRAIDARIAVVELRFAADLGAERQAEIAAGQRQQTGVG